MIRSNSQWKSTSMDSHFWTPSYTRKTTTYLPKSTTNQQTINSTYYTLAAIQETKKSQSHTAFWFEPKESAQRTRISTQKHEPLSKYSEEENNPESILIKVVKRILEINRSDLLIPKEKRRRHKNTLHHHLQPCQPSDEQSYVTTPALTSQNAKKSHHPRKGANSIPESQLT